MMNRKQTTTSLTIVGMALLATVATMSLPTQALALDQANAEEDSSPVAYEAHVAYKVLQACLSDAAGQGSPTEQEVQGCVESSYAQRDSSEDTSTESAGNDNEDENSAAQSVSTGNTEAEDDDENEDDQDENSAAQSVSTGNTEAEDDDENEDDEE
jgi:hypothetical protein